jgi:hypothetical protein
VWVVVSASILLRQKENSFEVLIKEREREEERKERRATSFSREAQRSYLRCFLRRDVNNSLV